MQMPVVQDMHHSIVGRAKTGNHTKSTSVNRHWFSNVCDALPMIYCAAVENKEAFYELHVEVYIKLATIK